MSEHHAKISWRLNNENAPAGTYSRDHTWAFPGGVEVPASAAPGYTGNERCVDPEEALVAALSSCHMLTFLAIAEKKKIVVETYTDDAIGYLEKNDQGKLAVTRVRLRPQVTFAEGGSMTAEQLDKLHQSAHRNCFIANSVNTDVSIET